MRREVAVLALLAFPAQADTSVSIGPGYEGGPELTVEIQPYDGAFAQIICRNELTFGPYDVQAARVTLDGVTVTVTVRMYAGDMPDVFIAEPPEGFIADPPQITVREGDEGTILIYPDSALGV